jgi:hypothetical protein
VADTDNHVIRAIDLESGVIERVAGSGEGSCRPDENNPGGHGPALEIQLDCPFGIEFGPEQDLWIADSLNSRIVRVFRQ